MNLNLQAMSIELPAVARHPNRVPFRGVLTLLDVPSDSPVGGARGHRVLLTRAAAEKALPSLLGMALDYAPEMDGHDERRKVGVITRADIVPAANAAARSTLAAPRERPETRGEEGASRPIFQLEIAGYIYGKDFPEVVERMRAGDELGMSYEITDVSIANTNAYLWTITAATFTGAAMLLRRRAAYQHTWIQLESAANPA